MTVGLAFIFITFFIVVIPMFFFPPGLISRKKAAIAALGFAFGYAGAYMCITAWFYKDLLDRFPELYVTKYEPDFFAVQTMTTVGYGIELCDHLKSDPNAPELLHSRLCDLHEEFHKRASFLMVGWALGWLLIIRSLIQCAKRVFFPD